MNISKTHYRTKSGQIRHRPNRNAFIVRDEKAGVWIVLYANETKAQEFSSRKEAEQFKNRLR